MEFIERAAATLLLRSKLAELSENAFEEFFHSLMSAAEPSYIPVRTAGPLGDVGADGLLLIGDKLYACYGPQVFDASRVIDKFWSDLNKAKFKRSGQFTTFVFAHNDLRGVHPTVSSEIVSAKQQNTHLNFEVLGLRQYRAILLKLSREDIEDVLGCPLPTGDRTFNVGVEDLTPLLDHLVGIRAVATLGPVPPVSDLKMEFNQIEADLRSELIRALQSTYRVSQYYDQRRAVMERDEVAKAMTQEYLRVKSEYSDPEEVVWQLENYILGNVSRPPRVRRAAMVILAHFFETCDIFDEPAQEWLDKAEDRSA